MIGGKKFAVVRKKWQNDGQKDERTKIELLPRYFFFCCLAVIILPSHHSASLLFQPPPGLLEASSRFSRNVE
jgi:hypothetical protein